MFYSCALGIVYHTEPELERIPFPRWEMVLGLLFASSILFLILKKKKKKEIATGLSIVFLGNVS